MSKTQTEQVLEPKGEFYSVSQLITEILQDQLFTLREDVEKFIIDHIEDMVMVALGFEKDSFRNTSGQYKCKNTNNISGFIEKFIKSTSDFFVTQKANEAFLSISGQIGDVQIEKAQKFRENMYDVVKKIYSEAYEKKLHDLTSKMIKEKREQFTKELMNEAAEMTSTIQLTMLPLVQKMEQNANFELHDLIKQKMLALAAEKMLCRLKSIEKSLKVTSKTL